MEVQKPENSKKYRMRNTDKKQSIFQNTKVISLIVLICIFLLTYFVTIANLTPEKYNIQVGSVATETIEATKDIVDSYTTDLNKKAASDSVNTKYTQDNTAQTAYVANETTFFDGLISLKTKEYALITARAQEKGTSVKPISEINLASYMTDADYNTLKTVTGIEMTKDEVKNALNMSDADIEKLRTYVKEQTAKVYITGIKEEAISQQVETTLGDIKTKYSSLYNKLSSSLKTFLTAYLKPNIVEDVEATKLAKQEAEDAVNPVTFQKGQTIVRKGDIVTEAQYSVIDDLGLINNSSIDLSLYAGVGLYIAVLLAVLAYYLYHYEKKLFDKRSNILLLGIVVAVTITITFVLSKVDPRLNIIYYGALLCAVVFNVRIGAFLSVFLSLMVMMIVKNDTGTQNIQVIYIAVASLIGSMAGLLYSKRRGRSNYLKSGLIAGFVSALAIAAILAVTNNDMTTLLTTCGYMIVNAFVSSVLLIGSLPIYEMLFNILTDSKLIELSDPKNPLLKRLAMEAPGTYHHSMLVANLAENAAETIGANGLLARVGAYYHDIGKLRRPAFFAENQQGENPHDNLSPKVSASIILSHPKDGLRFANQYKLPKEICDIIEQHHGTTLAVYFYDKASETDEEVNISDFRYDGGKPVSKEAAIVMLADTVEAAIRAMKTKTEDELKERIDKLVDNKMRDGQLDECYLSFSELSKIKSAFCACYNGASHKRIEYPEIKWPDEDN